MGHLTYGFFPARSVTSVKQIWQSVWYAVVIVRLARSSRGLITFTADAEACFQCNSMCFQCNSMCFQCNFNVISMCFGVFSISHDVSRYMTLLWNREEFVGNSHWLRGRRSAEPAEEALEEFGNESHLRVILWEDCPRAIHFSTCVDWLGDDTLGIVGYSMPTSLCRIDGTYGNTRVWQ